MPYKDLKKRRENRKKYRKDHRSEIANQAREYFEIHKEEILEYKKKYNLLHVDQIKKYKRKYYLDNKEKIDEYRLRYCEKHENKVRHYQQKYKEEHREENRIYIRNKKKEDPQFRLRVNLRCRLLAALRGKYKSGSAIRDLGCTISELKAHLENQFISGMTWNNWTRNGWHIDHKIPLSFFDLTDREQLLKAVHYTNLQPLWADDNYRKNKKQTYGE